MNVVVWPFTAGKARAPVVILKAKRIVQTINTETSMSDSQSSKASHNTRIPIRHRDPKQTNQENR